MDESVWAKCGNIMQCSLAQDGDLIAVSEIKEFKCHARLGVGGSCGVKFQDADGAPIAAPVNSVEELGSSENRSSGAKLTEKLEQRNVRFGFAFLVLLLAAVAVSSLQKHSGTGEQPVKSCENTDEIGLARVADGGSSGQLRESVDFQIACGNVSRVVAALRAEVEQGNGMAALVLADTYNPMLRADPDLNELPVSFETAYTYYRLALESGEHDAACRLERLKARVEDLANAGEAAAIRQLSIWPDTLKGC